MQLLVNLRTITIKRFDVLADETAVAVEVHAQNPVMRGTTSPVMASGSAVIKLMDSTPTEITAMAYR